MVCPRQYVDAVELVERHPVERSSQVPLVDGNRLPEPDTLGDGHPASWASDSRSITLPVLGSSVSTPGHAATSAAVRRIGGSPPSRLTNSRSAIR